uniref:F-box domain-containing protein n=1 Tax=Meloidogyne enterolobii TaxID=390850 RepID=A0A6V7VN58_MELEN|nr:unnamed protein product [Meloidogyne enterolobii]
MISLPIEVQLRILKYLNFNELISVKQTNSYFCNLISKYEGELARRKFYKLTLLSKKELANSNKIIDLRSTNFMFTLDDQLKEKWQAAIAKSTRLFLHSGSTRLFLHSSKKLFICMSKTGDEDASYYILKLPNFPKNLKEMIIVRYWLEQLFKCIFVCVDFDKRVFNQEMINILFDNDKTIPLQFNIRTVILSAGKKTIENILKFYLNHLSNSERLYISLRYFDITDHHINILFNIIINKGNKIRDITVEGHKIAKLHDLILEYIITSKDCSNMLPRIIFVCFGFPNFKLSEKAENVKIDVVYKSKVNEISNKYQIANIYNPNVRFEICKDEASGEWGFCNIVEIMKKN